MTCIARERFPPSHRDSLTGDLIRDPFGRMSESSGMVQSSVRFLLLACHCFGCVIDLTVY